MADLKKQKNKLILPEIEEEVNPVEEEDINHFIRKTQIQNEILKKIKESLSKAYPVK